MVIETAVQEKVLAILDGAKEPFFFFDDDPDGLCAFLLLYRRNKEGTFYPVKSRPEVDARLVKKVRDAHADAVFILDIARVEQEFLDKVGAPVVWVDHHPPQKRSGAMFINPLREGEASRPTSALAFELVGEDVWIAAIGAINDQYWPEFVPELRAKYPALLPDAVTTIEDARFNSPLGMLARVFAFVMKGARSGWVRALKALVRVKDPQEILDRSSDDGRMLWNRYLEVNEEFEGLREQAMRVAVQDGLWVFTYVPGKYSVTRELADYMISLHRDALLVLGREKDGEYRCSLRSREGPPVKPVLEYALKEVRGYGGGHERACGAGVAVEDWPRFLERLKEGLALWRQGALSGEATRSTEKDL